MRDRALLRPAAVGVPLLALLAAASCTWDGVVEQRDGPPRDEGRVATADAVPRAEAPSRYGNPESYVVRGKRYYPLKSARGFTQRGVASWYGTKFHGRRTSSGEPYDMYAMTAAHKKLPLPSYVRVTHLETGRSVVVRVNDRGPFHAHRVIDLSYAAAKRLGIVGRGTGPVEIAVVEPRPPRRPAAAADRSPLEGTPGSSAGHRVALYLQVGAYRSPDNAHLMVEKLRALGPGRVDVRTTRSEGRTWYRVRLGPVPSIADAHRLTTRLVAQGLEAPLLVVEPNPASVAD